MEPTPSFWEQNMSCSFPEIEGMKRLLIPLFFKHIAWIFPEGQPKEKYGDYSLEDDEAYLYPSDLPEEVRALRTTYIGKYEHMVLLMDEATPQASTRVLLVGTDRMPGDVCGFSYYGAEIVAERQNGSEEGVNWSLLTELVKTHIETAYALTVHEQIEEIMSTARSDRDTAIRSIFEGDYSKSIGDGVSVKRKELVRHLDNILHGEDDAAEESVADVIAGDGMPADAAIDPDDIEPDETDPFRPA